MRCVRVSILLLAVDDDADAEADADADDMTSQITTTTMGSFFSCCKPRTRQNNTGRTRTNQGGGRVIGTKGGTGTDKNFEPPADREARRQAQARSAEKQIKRNQKRGATSSHTSKAPKAELPSKNQTNLTWSVG